MKKETWWTGVLLIVIGLIFLSANVGLISWSFVFNISVLWPLIVIIIGVNIIFKENYKLRTCLWIFFLLVLVGYSFINEGTNYNAFNEDATTEMVIEKEEIQSANLDIKVGGTNLNVMETSEDLIRVVGINEEFQYYVTSENDNEKSINLQNRKNQKNFFNFFNRKSGKLDIHLDKDIYWNIKSSIGAVSGDLNFKDINLKSLNLDVGAGNLDIHLGNNVDYSEMILNAGASNIKIYVPEELGVKISSTGALNNTNLNRLGWEKDGDTYKSLNYEEMDKKMDIEIKMGVGNLNIEVEK
ncbi:LiaF-related protein [Serpentinicella sp. ANB-PHB4]|uniref:LiaF transmembrane domain-containing protein n=1 Tax=Serpentinicella sp. ANB-PHB4 TaxID=3074076 RepID=UPI002859F72E|nr:LiaF domain-containing protein [Serpentinicella sp. ANB-PHB4]MDR5659607.1 LiaF-related protein [Serpentinicella sp. ANB-PHB4]